MAEKVFREPPKNELLGGSSQLQTVREHLRRHLTRAERDELQARGRAFIDAEKAKEKASTTPTPAPAKAPEQVQERTQEPTPAPKKSRDFER